MNLKPSNTNQNKAKHSKSTLQASEEHSNVSSRKVQISSFKGVVPDPDTVERYEKLHPGAVDFFFDSAHSEQQHRHNIELKMIELEHLNLINESKEKKRGQLIAFAICLLFIALGFFGFYTGNAVEVKWIIGIALSSVVALFLGARWFFKQKNQPTDTQH